MSTNVRSPGRRHAYQANGKRRVTSRPIRTVNLESVLVPLQNSMVRLRASSVMNVGISLTWTLAYCGCPWTRTYQIETDATLSLLIAIGAIQHAFIAFLLWKLVRACQRQIDRPQVRPVAEIAQIVACFERRINSLLLVILLVHLAVLFAGAFR